MFLTHKIIRVKWIISIKLIPGIEHFYHGIKLASKLVDNAISYYFVMIDETTEESSVSDDSRNEESIHARRSLADASGPFTRVDGSRKRSQSSDRHLGSSDGKTQASSTDETEGKLHELGATATTSPKK